MCTHNSQQRKTVKIQLVLGIYSGVLAIYADVHSNLNH